MKVIKYASAAGENPLDVLQLATTESRKGWKFCTMYAAVVPSQLMGQLGKVKHFLVLMKEEEEYDDGKIQ